MKIPVYKPWLTDVERRYLNEAFDSGWISAGRFVQGAEEELQKQLEVKRAVICSNGTTALHLALRACDIRPGEKVLIPGITFIATAFAASYCGAEPVFVDIDERTWNIDTQLVERAISLMKVSAIIPVHLYGNPANVDFLNSICKAKGIKIIEDSAESFGSTIDGLHCGTLGDVGILSFYGNKTITAAEGGAVITNNDTIANRATLFRGQAQDPKRRYWHIDVGHNYRMTDMQAAVLFGQLQRSQEIIREKDRVYDTYKEILGDSVVWQSSLVGNKNLHWLITVKTKAPYYEVASKMAEDGIETRPVFYPLSSMPPYSSAMTISAGGVNRGLPVSERLNKYGISLPSYPQLTTQEIEVVCDSLKRAIKGSNG